MYTLIIGRAFPAKETGMMGIFEFEQAVALKKHVIDTVYVFCDTRSVKVLRRFNYRSFTKNKIPVYGYHFPIGGIPKKLFDKLKTNKYKKLIKTIIKEHGKPTYIHIHFPLLTLNREIWGMLKELQIPLIVTEHWSKVQRLQLEKFRIDFLKKVVKESNDFLTVSYGLKKSVLKITKSNKDIKVFPNMLQPYFFYEEKRPRNNLVKYITIGRLVPDKNIDQIIIAFSKILKNLGNSTLDIIGSGKEYKNLIKLAKSLNIESKVNFHGFLNRIETAEILKNSNVYVSASQFETFGVPYIEAMACGIPVIAPIGSELDHLITENKGVLYDPIEIQNLENALLQIDFNIAENNSETISKNILNNYGERVLTKRLYNIYKSNN